MHNGFIDGYKSQSIPPKIVENHIPREKIMTILDSVPLDQMVYITAPFGYGKTQSVLQWLDTHNYIGIFCTIKESNMSIDSLMKDWSASLFPVIEGTLNMEDRNKYSKNPQKLWMKVASAANNSQHYALVIRGLHLVKDLDTLKFLKNYITLFCGIWRIFILSSGMISPIFNDLILLGRIYFITADNLRLDINEIKLFLSQNGIDAASKELADIELNTRGWFAALNAMVTDFSARKDWNYEQAGRDFVFHFFDTEIWNDLDSDTHEFLLRTSILDKLDSSACYALTDMIEASSIITRLYMQGVFVCKNKDDTYEYHPLFKKFLRQKLNKSDIDINILHTKLAWWLYNQKNYAAAFRYFSKAKFLYGIDKALKKFDISSMLIEIFLDLVGGITTLDPYELKQFPNILIKIALIEHLTGNTERMKELLSLFDKWLEPGELPISPEEYAEFYWEIGWLHYLDPDETQLNNKRLESLANYKEYVSHLEHLHIARAAALGFASFFRGIKDFSTITSEIQSFVKSAEACTQTIIKDNYTLLETHLLLAEYYYEIEQPAKSFEETRKVLPYSLSQSNTHMHFVCIALMVKILRSMDRPKEIASITASLERNILDKGDFFLLPNFHAFQQINFLRNGNIGFISVFYEENSNLLNKNHFYLLYRKIAYVRTLMSIGEYSKSLILLDLLESLCEKYNRVLDLIEICLLKSISLLKLNDNHNAVNSIKKALHTGKPYGYIRIFADEADDLLPIFSLLDKAINDSYMKQVLISIKKAMRKNMKPQQNIHVELTKTEIQILKSLQNNFTYKEIAFERNIKLTTVRTHIQSIYGKLGVNNKTSAIHIAKKQGLL